MTALIPPFVLELIAKDGQRAVACGPAESDDVQMVDIKAAAAKAKADGTTVEPMTIVTEVFRQHSNGRLVFTVEHMGRYAHKLESSFGIKSTEGAAGGSTVCDASFNAVARLMTCERNAPAKDEQCAVGVNGMNIGLVTWAVSDGAEGGAIKVMSLAYYKATPAIPEGIAAVGVAVSLIFNGDRKAALAVAGEHKEGLGVFDSLLLNKEGVAYDGAACRLMCVAEGAAVVPLDYTPTASDDVDAVLAMDVSLVGLKGTCDRLQVDFRTLDISVGHLAFADCVALMSDDHDIVPVAAILLNVDDKDKINPAFLPSFVEKDGWLVLRREVTEVHTGLINKINHYNTEKAYQWGDDLKGSNCAQQ